MGAVTSCFAQQRDLKRKVETGDRQGVLEIVREFPGLLVQPCFAGKNTLIHVVCRFGQTAILAALLQLVDELVLYADSVPPPLEQHEGQQQSPTHVTSMDRRTFDTAMSELSATTQGTVLKVPDMSSGLSKRRVLRHSKSQASSGCKPDYSHMGGPLPSKQQLCNALNSRRQTPLIIAASRGHADLVQILMQTGANLFIADTVAGCTALHYACMYGHLECARSLILAAAAGPAGRSSGTGGGASERSSTPRIITLSRSQVQDRNNIATTSTSSLQRNTRMSGTTGPTASSAAIGYINMASQPGATALHFAADAGHTDIVKMLCAHGADINAAMRPERSRWLALHHGATPLHLAAEQGHLQVALALLRFYHEHSSTNTSITDPRIAQDRAGLRPHQLAFLTHHFRVALVIRPGYPLRWLFELPTPKSTLPTLAQLSATALRKQLCTEIDALLEAQQAQLAAAASAPSKPVPISSLGLTNKASGGGASGRLSSRMVSSGLTVGVGTGVTRTSRQNWMQESTGRTPEVGGAGVGLGARRISHQEDIVFRDHASHSGPADVDSIREAAGLPPPPTTTTTSSSQAANQRTGMQQPAQPGQAAADNSMGTAPAGPVPLLRLAGIQSGRLHDDDVPVTDVRTARGVELDLGSVGVVSTVVEVMQPVSPGQQVESLTGGASGGEGGGEGTASPVRQVSASGVQRLGFSRGLSAFHTASFPHLLMEDVHEEIEEVEVGQLAQDKGDDEDVCDVCFEEGPRVRLRPCCHEMCLSCARKVCNAISSSSSPATCPFCRGVIAGFKPGIAKV